jgi:hypothetical protein
MTNKAWYGIAAAVALGLLGAAAWIWWQGPSTPAQAVAPAPVASSPPPAAPAASASAAAAEPAIRHPVEGLAASQPPAGPLDVDAALTALFGRKAVLSLFQLQDFAHRFVATVDNLGASRAPSRLWPLNPVEGPFIVETKDGGAVISADNGLRYTPYVLLLETVDLHQAVALYARLYPQLQQAYEDLGYPKRYFNDRLVDVIDQLLATPDVSDPLKVRLPQINGPLQPQRPWVLYEFEDSALRSLSAGQKLLLRMGPVNERRVKTRLREIRRLVTAAAASR